MKLLFLTSSDEDYLSDSLLIGLRRLLGADCIDFPRRDILYADCPATARARIRGHGFTLYGGLLAEASIDRSHIRLRLERREFDLVIVSDIWRQFGFFEQWREFLDPTRTIICDGADSPQVYPHAGVWWRRPSRWLLPRATRGFLYFKREWTEDSRFNLWHRLFPRSIRRRLPHYHGMRSIAFAVPEEKIILAPTVKSKDFGLHIVDAEVASKVHGSSADYAFASEVEYYRDLQASRFGITTKRSGWDCLRHYEIAGNGCIPCFRNLGEKPSSCAPHGLVPDVNCISYRSWPDLRARIDRLSSEACSRLSINAVAWARANSCKRRAEDVLEAWRSWCRPRPNATQGEVGR